MGISGQFTLPQNTSLVSAVYWLHGEPQCEFSQPLILEIEHCATSSQKSRLSFARCSHYSLPYNFEILEEGNFSLDAYGCIQLRSFSLITVLKSLPLLTWIFGADDVKYCARVYYLWREENQREIHFVITKDLETHATVCSFNFVNRCSFHSVDHYCYYATVNMYSQEVQRKCDDKGAEIGPHLRVEFEASSISLDLPFEGVTLEEGWKLLPLFHPEVKWLYSVGRNL